MQWHEMIKRVQETMRLYYMAKYQLEKENLIAQK